MRVRFTVPESGRAAGAALTAPATPRVFARRRPRTTLGREGRLVFVDNAVDPASGTLLLKGEFAEPRRPARGPGSSSTCGSCSSCEPNAVIVPAPAVTTGQQGAFVYVVEPDSTAVDAAR